MSVQRKSQVVDHGIPGGPLRRRVYPDSSTDDATNLFLAYCPVCGPAVSFEGQKKASKHLEKHDPEDFGLSPRGERP